ncbi:MAG: class I tRNA ligase family protein, partial [Candidatus Peregrinibacteria bacterium]|nr:class I tRNA ligase family protein [Candidatus Peregrinibacteria bacterium]
NSYAMRHDQTATAKFRLLEPGLEGTNKSPNPGSGNTYILAWTTTPWTLPSNFALAVNPELEYVKFQLTMLPDESTESLIMEKTLFKKKYGMKEVLESEDPPVNNANIIQEFLGKDLIGKTYEPLFPYFAGRDGLHEVRGADFASAEDGTGIVHLAPYGEDDFNTAKELGLDIIDLETVDDGGNFKDTVTDFVGMAIMDKDTNKKINEWLENEGKLFEAKQCSHNYPHCWRCETPLFYNPQRAYFLNVQKVKDKMIANNENINWEPKHLKEGRFKKGLETAPDWNLSRNRFWGSPIPIWKCDNEDCEHEQVVGSIEELERLCGEKVEDLHKHFVDKYTWDCEKCASNSNPGSKDPGGSEPGLMRRTPEVLDCWFESGAMPYAQKHFPFENEDHFKQTFPGDFIAEYIAQTRGWFYTLHVLSTALMDSHSFKNVVCTGTILAEDGTKMSKSKKNYPDPTIIFEKYGSDAMRFYLMASSVMKGENFNFSEHGVAEVLKNVILPLKSAYQFFSTYANIDDWQPTRLIFARHGEADQNVAEIYSGNVENHHHLTEKGKSQVAENAKTLPEIDAFYASPFIRTQETVGIINKQNLEVTNDDRLREAGFGSYEGKPYVGVEERIKDSSCESISSMVERLGDFISEVTEKHRGQTVCVVSHGDPIRAARHFLANAEQDFDNFKLLTYPDTGKSTTLFANPTPKTELDKWILSELQTLIKEYRTKMDGYEISAACATIPPFIDKLNNWFLRRSRARFWAGKPGEISDEKRSGFETIFHVLTTLSKLLAPICPFFAEKLYRDLCAKPGKNEPGLGEERNVSNPGSSTSVHLEFLPFANEELIDNDLSQKIDIIREIVSLAAGIRARSKVKLRQPLAKLSCAVSGVETKDFLSPEDLKIIREEANVKEIEILSVAEVSKFARKIVKVDARQVGRKFGKKVQELIVAGKNGEFKELENGAVEIAGETLEAGEFEFTFLCEGTAEADSTARSVVILETEISEDLRLEGLAREIIRAIQEKRKENNFEISDRIKVAYTTPSEDLDKVLETFGDMIAKEVLATEIDRHSGLDAEEISIDGEKLSLSLAKN